MVEVSEEDLKTGIITINTNAFEPKLAYEMNRVLISELDLHQQKKFKNKNR